MGCEMMKRPYPFLLVLVVVLPYLDGNYLTRKKTPRGLNVDLITKQLKGESHDW